MPKLRYPSEQTVKAAEQAVEVECRGVNIRLPSDGSATITFYFEAMDSRGKVVDSRPLTVPVPPGVQAQVDALVQRALNDAPSAGYPAGGSVV